MRQAQRYVSCNLPIASARGISSKKWAVDKLVKPAHATRSALGAATMMPKAPPHSKVRLGGVLRELSIREFGADR